MYYKQKILQMEEGLERELMVFYLSQIKQARGLTTTLDDDAGINGKWLNPNEAYDIHSKLLLRTVVYKVLFQTKDEVYQDIHEFIDFIYELIDKYIVKDNENI